VSSSCKLFVLEAGYHDLHGLAFAFSALRQPSAETLCKALRSDAKAGFYLTFGKWQGVIKFRGIGEIPHAELIQPLQRANSPLSTNH
jgi:hypothetical protein